MSRSIKVWSLVVGTAIVGAVAGYWSRGVLIQVDRGACNAQLNTIDVIAYSALSTKGAAPGDLKALERYAIEEEKYPPPPFQGNQYYSAAATPDVAYYVVTSRVGDAHAVLMRVARKEGDSWKSTVLLDADGELVELSKSR